MQRTAGAAEADAHDAVQNAMIKLFRCWGRPDQAYLITITLRECARIVKPNLRGRSLAGSALTCASRVEDLRNVFIKMLRM